LEFETEEKKGKSFVLFFIVHAYPWSPPSLHTTDHHRRCAVRRTRAADISTSHTHTIVAATRVPVKAAAVHYITHAVLSPPNSIDHVTVTTNL
jgi:hypothetical protein